MVDQPRPTPDLDELIQVARQSNCFVVSIQFANETPAANRIWMTAESLPRTAETLVLDDGTKWRVDEVIHVERQRPDSRAGSLIPTIKVHPFED